MNKSLANTYQTNLDFQILDYSPSFNRLLLRSHKNDSAKFNTDLIFFGVKYMDIPIGFMGGLKIQKTNITSSDLSELSNNLNLETDFKYILVNDSTHEYIIIAFSLIIIENNLEPLQSSIDKIDFDWFEYKKIS